LNAQGISEIQITSAKSRHHRQNKAAESRLIETNPIEERAAEIAGAEGHEPITADDRRRAREELLAPNETPGPPEVGPELGREITAWDEASESSGTRAVRIAPEDEASIGKELVEKGLRGPRQRRRAEVSDLPPEQI
jgi:hypothetical protein